MVWELATAVNDQSAAQSTIYATGKTIVIENATDEIFVYDAMGALIGRYVPWRLSTGTTEITINNPGVYIVKTGNTAQRVVVN